MNGMGMFGRPSPNMAVDEGGAPRWRAPAASHL